MFKSIEYQLYIYLILLVASTGLAVYLFTIQAYVYAIFFVFLIGFSIVRLYMTYNKYNKNILFLLNAIESGDYAFNFTEKKLSRRERELNRMMNRIRDILSKAKQEVVENEKFLSLIIQNVPTGLIILDDRNNVRHANSATTKLLGLPVFTHLNQLRIINKDLPDMFRELKVGDENKQIKILNEKEEVQISLSVSSIKIQSASLKIITLYSINDELEAKEMESWVKLIRVMTHEIMNSIAPITSLTDTLLFSYKNLDFTDFQMLKDTTIDALSVINSTAKGLTSFVESYRQFSGVAKPTCVSIQLLPFISSILMLEDAEMKSKNINVALNYDSEELTVLADSSQLSQVIVNLLKNAIEALNDVQNPTIKINISREQKDKIQINIANNGAAIPSEVVENIFIPFFTTKKSGSGIGLSVSRYIMRLHGGNLKHSFEDGWTIFSLSLLNE
ncbi:GHKL domain-containing protein [Dysgonomonas sp. Marseille-P4677]|uniref:sensor histidine kinase n=1 Tax=Dysgonomonas sp. Marseille-P4677 TaxID=2364790 RepID=UPI0019126A70|nr:ATP-binding protein [Dysgonomonas sp. Marseille-P4677]MBK5722881.1 GHKL domain-containing protein [Dysgonomonas sp. Marseille-P4677]